MITDEKFDRRFGLGDLLQVEFFENADDGSGKNRPRAYKAAASGASSVSVSNSVFLTSLSRPLATSYMLGG